MINLEAELKFWQGILSLRDTDITVSWSDPEKMPINGAQACIAMDFENNKATITILKPEFLVAEDKDRAIRENLVHELLHIHLERWDEKLPDAERHRERAINMVAKGLVSLYELNRRPRVDRDSVKTTAKYAGTKRAQHGSGSRNKARSGAAKPGIR